MLNFSLKVCSKGQYVWPAAVALANHMLSAWVSFQFPLGIDVLELGAGVSSFRFPPHSRGISYFGLKF